MALTFKIITNTKHKNNEKNHKRQYQRIYERKRI